jgi:hypothetical protein
VGLAVEADRAGRTAVNHPILRQTGPADWPAWAGC